MRALVVSESTSGDAGRLAEAIAAGLRGSEGVERVDLVSAAEAPVALDAEIDLVVVGGSSSGPAASAPPGPVTHESTAPGEAAALAARGIRDWIRSVRMTAAPVAAATFDTRTPGPRWHGSTARRAMRALIAKGFRSVEAPTSFTLAGVSGSLADGELERARAWGATLTDDG
ncbi:hypothetical protein [Agromyces sp. SYSU T0242]|uniref:hypothetical protein n=1 Tax=Agromyces litoreus TaxID=3158561 RepID=UPI0033915E03